MTLLLWCILAALHGSFGDVTFDRFTLDNDITFRSYGEDASKPTIMFIPGGAGLPFPDSYPETLLHLAHVVMYDACSVRDSRKCTRRTQWSQMRDDVYSVFDAVAKRFPKSSYVIAGYSGGSFLVGDLARRNTTQIHSAVMISGVGDTAKAKEVRFECLQKEMLIPKAVLEWVPDIMVAPTYHQFCGSYCIQTSTILTSALCDAPWAFNVDLFVYYAQRFAVLEEYQKLTLDGHVPVPLHIISGAYDRVAPYSVLKELLDERRLTAPEVHINLLSQASHHTRYEEPDAFVDAIRKAFL